MFNKHCPNGVINLTSAGQEYGSDARVWVLGIVILRII
jgi:hypothetical protein